MVDFESNKRPTISEIIRDYFSSKGAYLEITEEAHNLDKMVIVTSPEDFVKKEDFTKQRIVKTDPNNIDDISYVWPTRSIYFYNYNKVNFRFCYVTVTIPSKIRRTNVRLTSNTFLTIKFSI